MEKVNLFRGLNINPIPLDFSQSMTTLEFLHALLELYNNLIEQINENNDKINEQFQTFINQQQIVINQLIKDAIADNNKDFQTDIEDIKTFVENELDTLRTVINFISNGETIDVTEIMNKYLELKSLITTYSENVALVKHKGYNEHTLSESALYNQIKAYTYMKSEITARINNAVSPLLDLIKTVTQNNTDFNILDIQTCSFKCPYEMKANELYSAPSWAVNVPLYWKVKNILVLPYSFTNTQLAVYTWKESIDVEQSCNLITISPSIKNVSGSTIKQGDASTVYCHYIVVGVIEHE